jgi:hypothetical protein
MNVQTRSEKTGLGYLNTMEEAFEVAQNNSSIWKISFTLPNGQQMKLVNDARYCNHTDDGLWHLETVD